MENAWVDFSFTEILAAVLWNKKHTMAMAATSKPSFYKAWNRKDKSTLSYVFEKSSLRKRRG
jgi:hypothetical protein